MELDVGWVKRQKYGSRDALIVYKTRAAGAKATLATALIEKMVLAGSLLSPAEIVERAHTIADLAIDDLEDRGWLLEVPPPPADITSPEQMIADAERTAARSSRPDAAE